MLGLLGGWFAFAPAASAEDFTFAVPVRVENLRFAESGMLQCRVATSPAGGATPRIFPSSTVTFAITGGGYRGTLSPIVTLPAGERRDGIAIWDCSLYINFRPPGGALVDGGDFANASFVAEYNRTTHQAIASSQMFIQGTFAH